MHRHAGNTNYFRSLATAGVILVALQVGLGIDNLDGGRDRPAWGWTSRWSA